MVKVLTYGTYDLLHRGHIRLLERARSLGDYLIVGVTADDFDKKRGKINVHQSLMERIEAVRSTGLADEIIVEEYEGQKIDDIKKFGVDIFTVGSDWRGKFDYLNEFCKVVYLDRTLGVSSSDIRAKRQQLRIGLFGEATVVLEKFAKECAFVDGVKVEAICSCQQQFTTSDILRNIPIITNDYNQMLEDVDVVYILSHPSRHYQDTKKALLAGKHVLCESPISMREEQCRELFSIAKQHGLILREGIKTAYATAYNRMILLVKGGIIGAPVSIEATCTSLRRYDYRDSKIMAHVWSSMAAWGGTVLLPVFQLLGTRYRSCQMASRMGVPELNYDEFTQMTLIFPRAVANLKVGKGVKSEGELIISGTKGYILVPSPWWKTDYFEVRYESAENNRRYFYQLDGEGIRNEIAALLRSITSGTECYEISPTISVGIAACMEAFILKKSRFDI